MLYRLDAVEDIIEHASAGDSFHQLTKGLQDLERLVLLSLSALCRIDFVKVARVHSGSCSIKDFLKLIQASYYFCNQSQPLTDDSLSRSSIGSSRTWMK